LIGALVGGTAGYLIARRQTPVAIQWPSDLPDEPEVTPWAPGQPFHLPFPPGEEPEDFSFELPKDLDHLGGALIQEVTEGSPADKASLRPGDLITAVDGQAVDEGHPLPDLIGRYRPGDRITLTIWRIDYEKDIQVRLGKRLDDPERPFLGVRFVNFSMGYRFRRPND
ncbi:MAG TPA: PDZ domain-containing protein, partial [Anaerolineae bacterium]|nr:PDZ domain-containing protein [Anaerolineae bacterium]